MGNSDLPDLRLGEAARRTGGPARSSRHGGRNYADDSTSGLADARQQRAPKTYGSRLRGQQRLPRSRYIKISGCRYAPAALRGRPERVPGLIGRDDRPARSPAATEAVREKPTSVCGLLKEAARTHPRTRPNFPTRGLASVPRQVEAPPRTSACRGTRLFAQKQTGLRSARAASLMERPHWSREKTRRYQPCSKITKYRKTRAEHRPPRCSARIVYFVGRSKS